MKYFIVTRGSFPGIYTNERDAIRATREFRNGRKNYGFTYNEDDAISSYEALSGETIIDYNDIKLGPHEALSFVDGSFNPRNNKYGCGGIVKYVDGERKMHQQTIMGSRKDKYSAMRNIAGELLGVILVLEFARKNDIKKIYILFDYLGICRWASDRWKCKTRLTKGYRDYVMRLKKRGLDIKFIKVKAHSGVEGNEMVDYLAKKSVGIIDKKYTKEE